MKPVNESRFLPSFFAVAASLVLVCGGIVLLTSTAPWTPRPTTEPSLANSEFYVAEAEAPAEIGIARATSEPGEARTSSATEPQTNSDEGTQIAEAQPASREPVQPVAAEPSSPLDGAATAAPGMPQAPEADGALAAEAVAAEATVVSETTTPESAPDADGTVAAEAVAAESMGVSETTTPESAPETGAAVAAEAVAAPMVASETETPESAPETGAAPEAAAVDSGEPAMPVAAETTEAATDQIGDLLEEASPGAIATETIVEDSDDATDLPAPAPAAPPENTSGAGENANPPTAAAVTLPPPPLPKRKPKAEPPASSAEIARSAPQPERPSRQEAPKQGQAGSAVAKQGPTRSAPRPERAEAPKQGQAGPAVAQQAPAQARSGLGKWLPMALAPADKPVPAQVPTARPSGAAYAGKVWAALARHKPRAGQNGSASVVFSIGPGGGLGGVRIGRSSGNTKIDQLALATVRSAAPFPPPPSGAASFSIRIDFH